MHTRKHVAMPGNSFFSVLLLLTAATIRVDAFSSSTVFYRQGQKSDELKIATTLAKELMNPLGVQSERFVVATDSSNNVIGWAQIKLLGELASSQRDPSKFDSRPGSVDLEQELDEAMWEEFEKNDNIQVPIGFKSFPWTKEYRAMEQGVKDRDQRRAELRAQRERELQNEQLWELSSVYVESSFRGQGIGSELVKRILRKRIVEDGYLPTSIYLLTLATTVDWYQDNFAFESVSSSDIPAPMAFEVTAGNFITKLIGAQLCCMQGTQQTLEICKSVPAW
ncbi:expressed unknown protein [Seminavis robusta]|uniref:N-acetyltransferase domain-containing protein n=1 Tax=Seminavis robusta TaxID=568900 RepID=A0A9N8HVN0_9STRA|nr:expressed unknown protein [Seminavis robusta]|eukprot:Sro2010_g310830.1 n/a (280) ;mRNA; r:13105-13944